MEQENRMKGLECTRFLARMAGWMGCFDGSGFERRSKLDGSGRDGKFSFGCVGFSLLWAHSVVSNKLLNVIWHLREILDLEIVLRISRKKVVINPQERVNCKNWLMVKNSELKLKSFEAPVFGQEINRTGACNCDWEIKEHLKRTLVKGKVSRESQKEETEVYLCNRFTIIAWIIYNFVGISWAQNDRVKDRL